MTGRSPIVPVGELLSVDPVRGPPGRILVTLRIMNMWIGITLMP